MKRRCALGDTHAPLFGLRLALAVLMLASAAYATLSARIQKVEPRLSGRVVDAVSGLPVSDAVVSIFGPGGRKSAISNEQGRFVIVGLSTGDVRLLVTHPSYTSGTYGQRFPEDSTALPVIVGREDLTVRVWPSAVITGRITRKDNARGITVYALRKSYVGGRLQYARVSAATVDRTGEYRLGNLAAATYVVLAVGAGVDARKTFPTFYPSAGNPFEALTVDARPGEVVSGIDIGIRDDCGTLTGRLLIQEGVSRFGSVQLTPAPTMGVTAEGLMVESPVAPGGRFEFPCVSSGEHVLRSRIAPIQSGLTEVLSDGVLRVSRGRGVQSDSQGGQWLFVDHVVNLLEKGKNDAPDVRPNAGARIAGRIVFAADTPNISQEALQAVRIIPMLADSSGQPMPTVSVDPQGGFVTAGLPTGKVNLVVMPGSGLNIVSISGPDGVVIDAPFAITNRDVSGVVVTLSRRYSEIVGQIPGQLGQRLATSVYVFPQEQKAWVDFGPFPVRFVETRVASDGTFRARVPPGNYCVVAADPPIGRWWNVPDQLAALAARGDKVTLRHGERVVVAVRAGR